MLNHNPLTKEEREAAYQHAISDNDQWEKDEEERKEKEIYRKELTRRNLFSKIIHYSTQIILWGLTIGNLILGLRSEQMDISVLIMLTILFLGACLVARAMTKWAWEQDKLRFKEAESTGAI